MRAGLLIVTVVVCLAVWGPTMAVSDNGRDQPALAMQVAQLERQEVRTAKPRPQAPRNKLDLDWKADTMPKWMNKITPNVGSPEWKTEQQETERGERRLKEAIQGICRGC